MKEWADKQELVVAVSQARRDARETGPRSGNDDLEAAMFIAMAMAMAQFYNDRDVEGRAEEPQTIAEPAQDNDQEQEPVQVLHQDEEGDDADPDTSG